MLAGNTISLFGGGPVVSQGNDSFTKLLLHSNIPNTGCRLLTVLPRSTATAPFRVPRQSQPTRPSFWQRLDPDERACGVAVVRTSTDYDFGAGDFTVGLVGVPRRYLDNHPVITRNATPQTYQPFMFGYTSGGQTYAYRSADNASWNVINALSLGDPDQTLGITSRW